MKKCRFEQLLDRVRFKISKGIPIKEALEKTKVPTELKAAVEYVICLEYELSA